MNFNAIKINSEYAQIALDIHIDSESRDSEWIII
jgi:hypothetical protein